MMMHCCKKSDGTEKEEVEIIDMTSYMDDPFYEQTQNMYYHIMQVCMNYVVNVLSENSVSCHILLAFRNNQKSRPSVLVLELEMSVLRIVNLLFYRTSSQQQIEVPKGQIKP